MYEELEYEFEIFLEDMKRGEVFSLMNQIMKMNIHTTLLMNVRVTS